MATVPKNKSSEALVPKVAALFAMSERSVRAHIQDNWVLESDCAGGNVLTITASRALSDEQTKAFLEGLT